MTVQINAWEHRVLAQAYAPLEERLRHDVELRVNRAQFERAYLHCQAVTQEHSQTTATPLL
jgi:hypothetical protein